MTKNLQPTSYKRPKKLRSYNLQASCGFSTLLVVIILGSVATGFILYASTTSLWSVRTSIDNKNSMQAGQLANACAELALEVMRENNSFTGSGNDIINGNACNYEVIDNGGNNRTINVTGVVGGITRKLQIITSSFNPINIVSWQNIADF